MLPVMEQPTVERPSTDRWQPSPGITVPEATERLGLTTDAVRSRLNRDALPVEKIDGQWSVFLEAEPTVDQPSPTVERPSC